MSLFGLSLAYIRARALNAALNLALLALGVAMIVLLLLFSAQLEDRLTRDARGIDLVIGSKGSPLQLILSSIYHVDFPTGNIPLAEAERWAAHPLVAEAIPLALGDSLAGFRIIGTEHAYAEHYGGELAGGRLWEAPFEATLGALVAARTGLRVGDRFVGSHGLAAGRPGARRASLYRGRRARADGECPRSGGPHADRERLAGPRHGTPRASRRSGPGRASTNGSTTTMHDEHAGAHDGEPTPDERRGAAASDRSRSRRFSSATSRRSPRCSCRCWSTGESALQAASPAFETARLLSLVGIGVDTLRGLGLLLIATAGLSVFIALSNAMQERRYDLAVMRTLGASRAQLFTQPLLEALLLAGAGALLGIVLGHAVAEAVGHFLPEGRNMGLSGLSWLPQELYVLILALLVGLVAALLPAIQAYRTDIAAVLASRA